METQGPGTPTPPPPPPPPPTGLTREQALAKVKPPAIALLVAAGIGVAAALLSIVLNLLGVTLGAAGAGDDPDVWMNLVGGGVGVVQGIVGIAIGAVIIFGAMKMMQLEMWPMALGAAIVAMIPCLSPCCLLGLPFGIWAIIVLADKDVKAAFT